MVGILPVQAVPLPFLFPVRSRRCRFEKPRTTIGWKGLINDPHLDGSHDIETGLKTARRLLLEITGMGLPTTTEFLDPIVPQYISELIAWAAIGARTTESQTHREIRRGRPNCATASRSPTRAFRGKPQSECCGGVT